jgi:hypothetical protein
VKTQVGLVASEKTKKIFPLLRAVAEANGLKLVWWNDCSPVSLAGILLVRSPGCCDQLPQLLPNLPSFRIELIEPAGSPGLVALTSAPTLSPLLHARKFSTADAAPAARELLTGEVLAEVNGHPVWTTRLEGGVRHDINIQVEPWIAEENRLFEHLNGQHLMRLLPIIEWFRSISDWEQWRKPPTRACFMFDDPNLHAERYGFISFRHLAEEGLRYRYHTSFATVPLDQYYVNKSAARLFRENPSQLSLLVHGIDHDHRELGGKKSSAQQLVGLHRAVKWIETLERRAGVKVGRIMAPPHGAFAGRSLRECAVVGFEAACVSWGSVWSSNPSEEWARYLGAEPITIVEGLPVIPRFRMTRQTENQILLTAYLNQPIIPVGHQWDLADGMELLSTLAGLINQLGDVRWQNMERIARSNFWWRKEGDILFVRPFSRRFVLHVPHGTRFVKIIDPCLISGKVSATESAISGGEATLCKNQDEGTWTLPVEGASVLTINMELEGSDGTETIRPQLFPLKALVRRVLVESRDRVMPILPRRWQRR